MLECYSYTCQSPSIPLDTQKLSPVRFSLLMILIQSACLSEIKTCRNKPAQTCVQDSRDLISCRPIYSQRQQEFRLKLPTQMSQAAGFSFRVAWLQTSNLADLTKKKVTSKMLNELSLLRLAHRDNFLSNQALLLSHQDHLMSAEALRDSGTSPLPHSANQLLLANMDALSRKCR